MEKEIIDSFATQVRLSATVVLMRDTIQKSSDTDKRIAIAVWRSVLLSYLLSLGAISAGGLSILSVGAILATNPAQANMKEQAASLPAQTVAGEQALLNNFPSSDRSRPAGFHQALANGNPTQAAEGDFEPTASITRGRQTSDRLNFNGSETSEASISKADAAPSTLQDLRRKDDAEPALNQGQPESAISAPTQSSIAQAPVFQPKNLAQATDFKFASLIFEPPQPQPSAEANSVVSANPVSSGSVGSTTDNSKLQAELPAVDKPTTELPTNAASPTPVAPAQNLVERKVPEQLALEDKPTPAPLAQAASPTKDEPAAYNGPGGASLLGGNIQAQTSVESQPQASPPSNSENPSQLPDPLAPTLKLQGGYLYQDDDSSARARLQGIYPISPNALFGATVDLTTGDGLSEGSGGGLQLNELYFTGSLPSLPNLRMTVGLMDLTSYFDRNSFAKDSLTHFFNPVFQTNPALAAAGIASRPGILLNWDITDNFQARAAAFSSRRNLGDFAIDGFAGELAYRAGNAIIRGTFASDRDAGRDNGFKEIYDLPRNNGERGLLSSDRENSYGINAEYYIPEIKMGLFGRYGHYENTALGEGGDTYSLGLNFLDLFMQDDRLGFGYGRDLSNNGLRRDLGNKVPDVWELFYDFRLLPNLRAGVTLQARDEFSDVIAGFRVKTEIDLLGRLFR